MGKRIDEDTIRRINEVYYEVGVKTKTAQIVGVSVASVNKYLIPNFKPEPKEEIHYTFEGEVPGCKDFMEKIVAPAQGNSISEFCRLCMITEDEWDEMNELQRKIFI